MFKLIRVEEMAWKNVEATSASALELSRGEKVRVNSSNDVSAAAFGGKRAVKLADVAVRLSVRRFEAQAVYAFTRSGSS